MNKDVQTNLHTFSSIFPNANFKDERVYSDAVAMEIQSQHHSVILPKDHIIESHKDLLYVLDMPIAGYSAPYRTLSKTVREHAKVVLTGHGGDELFCGYPKYIGAVLVKQMNESHAGITISDSQIGNLKYAIGFEKQLKSIFSKSLFGDDREILKALFYRSEHFWEHVNPEVSRQVEQYDVADVMDNCIKDRKTGFLKKLLYLDQKLLLPGLLHVEDRTSMVENLESRTPLLDREVVEFAARMPVEYLMKDGLKGMIRKAVEPFLPSHVTKNPSKSGTMYPAAELFENELEDLVRNDLQILDSSGLFTYPVENLMNMKPELVNKRNLWALWSLGAWMRSFGVSI
jgi:asparagine synthase (glutamine-hydrolysing)